MKNQSVEDIEKLIHEVMDRPGKDYSELAKRLHAKLNPPEYPREFWEKVLPGQPVISKLDEHWNFSMLCDTTVCCSSACGRIRCSVENIEPDCSIPGIWPHLGSDVCPVPEDTLVCVKSGGVWCSPDYAKKIEWDVVTEYHILEGAK